MFQHSTAGALLTRCVFRPASGGDCRRSGNPGGRSGGFGGFGRHPEAAGSGGGVRCLRPCLPGGGAAVAGGPRPALPAHLPVARAGEVLLRPWRLLLSCRLARSRPVLPAYPPLPRVQVCCRLSNHELQNTWFSPSVSRHSRTSTLLCSVWGDATCPVDGIGPCISRTFFHATVEQVFAAGSESHTAIALRYQELQERRVQELTSRLIELSNKPGPSARAQASKRFCNACRLLPVHFSVECVLV